MCATGRGQVDVAEALAAHLGLDDLDAALLAHDPAVLHALVLAAVALVVLHRAEDLGAEEAVPLRLERAVVDGLGLLDLAVRPLADLLRRRERDADRAEGKRILGLLEEAEDVAHRVLPFPDCRDETRNSERRRITGGRGVEQAAFAAFASPVAHSSAACSARWRRLDELDVQAERLQLLDEDVEALRQARLEVVLALDDGLVHPRAAHARRRS